MNQLFKLNITEGDGGEPWEQDGWDPEDFIDAVVHGEHNLEAIETKREFEAAIQTILGAQMIAEGGFTPRQVEHVFKHHSWQVELRHDCRNMTGETDIGLGVSPDCSDTSDVADHEFMNELFEFQTGTNSQN